MFFPLPMNTFSHLSPFLAVISGILFSGTALCNDIVLPPPDKKGGKPLMQVLHERHSTRSFADKPIPVEILSSLLWAAQGVNREKTFTFSVLPKGSAPCSAP